MSAFSYVSRRALLSATLTASLTPAVIGCRSGASAADPATARHDPTGAWWRRYFVDGKSRNVGRAWNVGPIFYNSKGGAFDRYIDFMGSKPDLVAGSINGSFDRATTWDQVIGGPLDARADSAMRRSQISLGDSTHMRWWLDNNAPQSWGVFCCTTCPSKDTDGHGSPLDMWQAVGDGKYNRHYEVMGRRLRWFMDNQTDCRFDQVILRPNWEFNQDTGLRPHFYKNGGTLALYNRMMRNFTTAFRAGYDHHVPIIFSPAARPANEAYADYFEFDGVYDVCDVSYHPARDTAGTPDQVRQALTGWKGRYTFAGDVIPFARKAGLPVSAIEWAPRFEAPPKKDKDYFPPEGVLAVQEFAKLVADNADIFAFTGAYHPSFVQPNFWMGDDPDDKGPKWRDMVMLHQQYFGKA